jgi:opacity protein-like surface antigen
MSHHHHVTKAIYIGAVGLALSGAPAGAADLAVKAVGAAPVSTFVPCATAQCTGFYVGGTVGGIGSNADILGSGINGSIFAGGAELGLHVGYQIWNGSFFAAAEVGGDIDVGGTTVIGSVANVKPYSATYVAKLGYGLNNLFGSGPPATTQPTIFQTLASSLISPYFEVGGKTRNFGTGFVSGAGVEYVIGPHWNAYAEYQHINYNQTVVGAAPVSIGTENIVKAGVNYKF